MSCRSVYCASHFNNMSACPDAPLYIVEENISGSIFIDHSQKLSLSFSQRFGKFEFNTTFEWLKRMV